MIVCDTVYHLIYDHRCSDGLNTTAHVTKHHSVGTNIGVVFRCRYEKRSSPNVPGSSRLWCPLLTKHNLLLASKHLNLNKRCTLNVDEIYSWKNNVCFSGGRNVLRRKRTFRCHIGQDKNDLMLLPTKLLIDGLFPWQPKYFCSVLCRKI